MIPLVNNRGVDGYTELRKQKQELPHHPSLDKSILLAVGISWGRA